MASRDLLEDDDVRRWYQNLARGSWPTADKNLRILARFCRLNSATPQGIIKDYRADRKAFVDRFMDFIEDQKNGVGNDGKERAASYLREYGVTLSSWVRHHGLDWPRGIKYGNTRATPTLRNERIPTKDELRAILHRASPRARVIIALVAFSGLRFEVLGDARGTDGLRMRDLTDFQVDGSTMKVDPVPARIGVRENLSKNRRAYFTLLSSEGCDILKAYLQERLDGGERLTLESAVIRVTPGFESKGRRPDAHNYGSPFLVTQNVRREVRRAFGSGFKQRPYVLRSYFATNLMYADAEVHVLREFREFWMGHEGTMLARYTVDKVLPPQIVEAMREAYTRAEPFLNTAELRLIARSTEAEAKSLFSVVGTSEENMEVLIHNPQPDMAHLSDEEKLGFIFVEALKKHPELKEAVRGIFFEE